MPLIVIMYALFASVFTIGKEALLTTQPLFLVGSRMTMAGLLMLAFFSWRNAGLPRLSRDQWVILIGLGFLNIYLTNALEFWALSRLPSFTTCFFYSMSPFLAALFGWLILSESISFKQMIGLIIGMVGFLPTIGDGAAVASLKQLDFLASAEFALFGAVVASVIGWILLKEAIKNREVPLLLANGYSMLIGGLMALSNSWVFESWEPLPTSDASSFLLYSCLLLIISNLICYSLYAHLLKRFSATFISFCGFITPVFTATYGFFFLGETIPLSFYVSYAIVFCGLYLFYQEELKKGIVATDAPAAAA